MLKPGLRYWPRLTRIMSDDRLQLICANPIDFLGFKEPFFDHPGIRDGNNQDRAPGMIEHLA